MPMSLKESIDAVLASVPQQPVLYEDFRLSTLRGAIENSQPALAYVVKNRLVKLELKPINTDTKTLVLTPEQTKKPDGTPVPYKHVLTISKLVEG